MFKLSRQQKDHRYFCGNKYEKYSIKKLKVGAASVLVGTGFLFGYNLDQVSANEQNTETTTIVTSKDGDGAQSTDKLNLTTEPKQEKAPEVGTETPKSETKEEAVPATSPQVAETKEASVTKEVPVTKETPATKEVPENKANKVDKEIVNSSTLRDKLADLEAQLERIRGNKKQASQIQNAEKLVAEAKQYLEALDTTQKEVDAKAKEISSLTNILKSIKAEEVTKENKNKDSRNGKKMEEGTGFRTGETTTSTTTGVGAYVVDATETPAVTRPPYTERRVAEGLAKQIAWLDFSDVNNWTNVTVENGNVYLQEGSIYEREIMPNYRIKLKVKSLKPFQATEIYRKRMEANNATAEEKATFNPNATNGLIDRTDNTPVRITAQAQDQWSEIRDNGINTNGRKTSIIADRYGANIGVQFEISGTYKGNPVRPAVVMTDAESANPGEIITFTTNGSGWQQIIDLEKNTTDARRYRPVDYYTTAYRGFPDIRTSNDINATAIYNVGAGNKIVPKFFTNPDQETGGLGTGVFGPGITAGKYSVPVVMTKNATEVGMYVFSNGAQAAMMGVAPIDEGDAPATYGEATHTMNTRDGLTGAVVKQPYLGSERPDADTGVLKNWHGDDDTDTADEGINQLLPDSLKGSEGNIIKANISNAGYYTLNIQAHTGGAEKAYVRSWIDFNNNGQFDSDEASDIAEITQDGDVKLHFTNKTQKDAGQLLEAGTRVRIATSREEIEKPTGLAFSGEVEDFNAKITHPPKGEKKTTIGNATIGTNVEIQHTTVHFTPKGKYIYTQDDVNAEIDTTVPPVYINNKTGEKVTLSDENTYTVRGQGTYKFTPNGKDVDVEFTPAKGFVGKAHGFTIRRQDTNKTTTDWGTSDEAVSPNVNDVLNTMDGLYVPEVRMPTVEPTPNHAESRNIQGFAQKGKPTFNVETSDTPVTASAKHPARLFDPRTNTLADSAIVDALDSNNNKVGTYKIAPETGEVTFTPNIDYRDEVQPVKVSVPVVVAHDKDDNDVTVTKGATYTPRIIPVAPTAEASTTRDVQGKAQVSRIVFDTLENNADKNQTVNFDRSPEVSTDGEHVELDKETLTLLNASGAETNTVTTDQGEYVLDKVSKTITFTPKKTFVGQATSVKVQIKDANGTKVETTYTPTVIEVTPTGKDSATSGPQGLTQKSPIVFDQREEEDGKTLNFDTGHERVALKPETLTLLNGTDKVKSITVLNVGTYELVDNAITFTPAPAYHGTAEGVNVQVEDENGKVVTKKYVPTVTELTVTPEGKTTKNIQGETQEGTPTFTIPAESTNNATVTSRKLVDPADQTEKDSVTVAGKGTFTIDGNGKVTFVPLPTYKGDVDPITVKATVTVTNAKNESATITSTASYKPIIVPAEIDKALATSTNLQGLVQTGTPTFTPKTIEVDGVQKTISVEPNSYKLVKDGAESESLPAHKAGTTDQIGTYTINPATGVVTFTPTDKTYTGAVEPVSVQATGSNGVKVQTTYTPTITPVTPTKEPSATTDVQGKKQVSRIVLDTVETDADKDKTINFNKGSEQGANGEHVELDPNTLTLLNDAGAEVTSLTTTDGEYVLDKASKTITFTPNKTFVGPAKPVKVQIKDVNGTKVETTYTPTVTDVTMTSVDKESSAPQGKTQTGTPTFTVSTPEVRITGYKLLNPTGNTPVEGNEIEVPDQGTYRIDQTRGLVTFIPKPGFTGKATGISVQATDENGETKDAKYTPTVNALTLTPQPATTTNIQGETQEGTPTFPVPTESNNVTVTSRKLVDPTDNGEKDSVTVAGKGTFTIDGNGKVTFTPLPTYKGDVDPITVKATVTITNDKNESKTIPSTTTYKPIIVSAEIDKAPATSTNLQGLVQTGTPTFTPKTVDVDGTPKTITVQPNSYKLVKGETESNTLPAYKAGTTDQVGTYTIDSATGQVTFTPSDKTYTGEVAPVSVQATGSNGVKVETTYTPIITPVTPTAEASATSDVQGKKQTSSIVLDTPENSADKDKTVNFNKGSQVGANGEHVELDASTLTLLDGNNEVTSLTTNDGEYVLDKASKTITFTPKKTFVGTATPVKVQIKDANGTKVETTYTPTVKDVSMSSVDKTSEAPQGKTQTGTPTFTISSPEVSITGYKLLNPNGNTPVEGNEIEVPKEGTYRINPTTGQVTFIPKPGFTGSATGISVQATDGNGETAEAKYTPTVNALTVTPGDKTTTNIQGVTQEETPTFTIPTESNNATVTSRKLVDPADQTEKDSVTVAGKGTFTIDVNGKVIFTPEPTFKGEIDPITVKATVTVTNAKNESATITSTATYKPVIVPAEIDKAPATSTNLQGLVQTGTPTFTPKTVEVNGVQKTISVEPNSYKLVKDGVASDSLPAYKAGTTEEIGTYTIDPQNGTVTFTPTDKTYTGAVAPVDVQATGSNGVKVETTYTPTITPVTPTAEKSATSGLQGKPQTSSIVLDTKETGDNKDTTVNFNKGSETGANGERVELDPNTLTLLNDAGVEVPTLTTDDGEYVLDKTNRTITFTPKKTFTGPAKAVKVQIKDANGTKVETTYTPTVTEVTPTGKDSATTGLQGFAQKSPIVFNQKDEEDGKTVNFDTGNEKVALKPDTLTLLNGNEKVKTVTVPDVGTYELKDNAITFTPLPSYHGTAEGVTVQVEDENGKVVTKKYVPTVTQVTPSGTNATSSGLQGKVQTGKPVFNGGVPEVPMNDEVPATLEGADQDGKVVIAGKGTYTVSKDGTVTFTPNKNFVGEAPAVTVKRVDKNGTIATATYTPTVTDVTMSSVDKTSEAPQGKTQTGTPEFSISTSSVRITEYKLVDPTNNTPVEEVEVENQGTYSIDKATGEVTFVPKPGFTGPTTGITVRATDENGETKDATYTPSVTPLKVTPENKSTTNIQGLPQEATPTFKLPKGVTNAVVTERKLIDPITKSLTNSVTVDGKGTFTINANGKVTFTPVPSYVGDVPAIEVQGTITVLNENNDSTTMTSKASYKPIIVPIELEKTPAESTNVQGLVQKGTPTFTPQSVDVNGVEKTVTVKPNSYKLVKDGTETDSIPAYKKDTQEVIGKYTIDPQTGEVTFTPTDKTYTGEVEPATVQATGSNNVKVQTTYTPIIKPVRPVGTNAGSEGIQGAVQEGTPTFKSGNENIPMTVSTTNPAKLVDPTTNQPIEATEIDAKNTAGEKVGKYTIDPATGKVTFTPEPGFSGTPVPATVQAKDGNGTPTTATYTPVVKAAVPSGDNQVTSDIQGAKQTATPVFTPGKNTVNNQEVSVPFEATSKAKLIDPSKTGDEREVTTLVVENQGTYTIDDNGLVTFTPLPIFKGEATAVSIVRKDKNGTAATATYKPSVVGVTPSATAATTTKVQGSPQESEVTFTPGKATIGTAEKSVPMDPTAYKLLGGQEGKTPLDTVPAMSEDGT
ncbi:YSIRK-type signal peptide-containing protein, partial [uncultured Streptococcus sp.]|uniref:Ig-like domain-containing protein n=1 Tax=uncultured Streptococcus sp. TaxID=83427 RepID=UPI003211B485